MKSEQEITVRNSKIKILLRLGFMWIVLLWCFIFKDMVGKLEEMWSGDTWDRSIFIFLTTIVLGFTFFHLRDLLDNSIKLKISAAGIEYQKKKFSWTDIDSIEFDQHYTTEITRYYLNLKSEHRILEIIEITDLDTDEYDLKELISELSGKDWFEETVPNKLQ